MGDEEWRKILQKPKTFKEGTVLVQQGLVDDTVTQIVVGTCDVILKEGAVSKTIAQIANGDLFGEMSFMTRLPASANIVATSEITCYSITRRQLGTLWKSHPEIVVKLYHYLCFVIASR